MSIRTEGFNDVFLILHLNHILENAVMTTLLYDIFTGTTTPNQKSSFFLLKSTLCVQPLDDLCS